MRFIACLLLLYGCVTKNASTGKSEWDLTPPEIAAWNRYEALAHKRCAAMRAEFADPQVCEDGFTDWCNRELREGRASDAGDCHAEFANLAENILPVDALCRAKDQTDPEGCLRDGLDPIAQRCAAESHGDYWGCRRFYEEKEARERSRRDADDERSTRIMSDAIRDAGNKIERGLNPPKTTCTTRPDYTGGVQTVCQQTP